jgi:phospholipid transport system substrate-binding protein
MLNRRALLLACLAMPALAARQTARADAGEQASAFVAQLGRDLIGVVNGPGGLPAKQAALEKLVDRDVDVAAVARFCLGRFWRNATPAQQAEYSELFHRVLVGNITGKLGEYQGVTFVVGRSQPREDGVAVSSVVTRPGNPPSKVDWIVSLADGSPKVIDLMAEGTSMRLTQRSDYSSFMSSHGNNVQALIDAMRQKAVAAN